MPFIQRDDSGHVTGVYAQPQYEACEWDTPIEKRVPIAVEEVGDDDKELAEYRKALLEARS